MSKIDLTAAELREFVRLWRTEPRTMAETSALRKLERRIPTFLPTTLAIALADAMEERDRRERELEELKAAYETSHASRVHADEAVLRLEADLEAARGRVIEAKLEGKIEALDDLWKPVRRDQTGKTVECTWADGVTPQFVYAEIDRIAREIANLPQPAVRAAWESKP